MNAQQPSPFLLIIAGYFAAGKTRLAKWLRDELGLEKVITVTTRPPRPSEEIDGVDYFFKTAEEFAELKKNGAFIETAHINGFEYGTLKATILEGLEKGKHLILTIDVQGYQSLVDEQNDLLTESMYSVFIAAPFDALVRRAVNRPDGISDEELGRRVRRALVEQAESFNFDKIVFNHDGQFEETTKQLSRLVTRRLIDIDGRR